MFVQIGRVGRSLGVHLLLASQRLEEGRLRGLETHLSYRIGLRTFSSMESRAVLGVPDAYELPRSPGHGFLKTGTEGMIRFRAAYVSGVRTGAATTAPAPIAGARDRPGPRRSRRTTWPRRSPSGRRRSCRSSRSTAGRRHAAGRAGRRMEGQGAPAHQVWLPPLAEPPTLDQLLPPITHTAAARPRRQRPGRAAARCAAWSASSTSRSSSAATRCGSTCPAPPATWSSSAARRAARPPCCARSSPASR